MDRKKVYDSSSNTGSHLGSDLGSNPAGTDWDFAGDNSCGDNSLGDSEKGSMPSWDEEGIADTIVQLHASMLAIQSHLFEYIDKFDKKELYKIDGSLTMANWLCASLSVSTKTGRDWAKTASSLAPLKQIARTFRSGELSYDQLKPLVSFATLENDSYLAKEAPGYSPSQLESLARAAKRVDSKDIGSNRVRRGLFLTRPDGLEGLVKLYGVFDEHQGALIETTLQQISSQSSPNPETEMFDPYEVQLADALVQLCSSKVDRASDPDRYSVVVHTDIDDLLFDTGYSEIRGIRLSSCTLERLLCDCRLQLSADDLSGKTVGISKTKRAIPAWLRRRITQRDTGCRFPGCSRKHWLEGHHIKHWAKGGCTSEDNLALLCGYHHHFVHEMGFRIEGDPGSELTFISPTGKRFNTRSSPLRPDVRRRLFGDPPTPHRQC